MDSISGLRFFFFFFVIDKTDRGKMKEFYQLSSWSRLELACLIPNFIPGGGNSNSLQYSCLKMFPGQRSLVGYHPWIHKESDITE